MSLSLCNNNTSDTMKQSWPVDFFSDYPAEEQEEEREEEEREEEDTCFSLNASFLV